MTELSEPRSRRIRWEEAVPLEDLCIPRGECLSVQPGPVDDGILSRLLERGYGQALVIDPPGCRFWGLVETGYLVELKGRGEPLDGNEARVRDEGHRFHADGASNIFELLDRLRARPAVVVLRGEDAGELGCAEVVVGLFTFSDLNRQRIRGLLSRLQAAVEAGLAAFLECQGGDPWSFIRRLGAEEQIRIVGYAETARRRDVDIGPLAALELPELLEVVARSPALPRALEFCSARQVERGADRLRALRHRLLHPVVPLVLAPADVEELYQAARFVENLRDRLERHLGRRLGA